MTDKNKTFVNVQMDADLEEQIRMTAAKLRISKGELMRQAITRLLQKLKRSGIDDQTGK